MFLVSVFSVCLKYVSGVRTVFALICSIFVFLWAISVLMSGVMSVFITRRMFSFRYAF